MHILGDQIRMLVANSTVASFSATDRVIAKIDAYICAFSAVWSEIAANMKLISLTVVSEIAGHQAISRSCRYSGKARFPCGLSWLYRSVRPCTAAVMRGTLDCSSSKKSVTIFSPTSMMTVSSWIG